jgi:hypothetical protein
MTIFTVETWPFRPHHTRTSDEQERWWRECYVPGSLDVLVDSWVGWNIITGPPGSGKSTLLQVFKRAHAGQSFIVDYHPASWERMGATGSANHLVRILKVASESLRHFFLEDPQKLAPLTSSHLEFLRWIIEKFNDPRAFIRWRDALPEQWRNILHQIEYSDIYPTQTEMTDVDGQLEELVSLLRLVGLQRLILLIDLNLEDCRRYRDQLNELFSWLELIHHPGLQVVVALPNDMSQIEEMVGDVRGRIQFRTVKLSESFLDEMIAHALAASTQGAMHSLDQLYSPQLLKQVNDLVKLEYGLSVPGAWIRMIEVSLSLFHEQPRQLDEVDFCGIQREYYHRFVPLQYDRARGEIYRGRLTLKLDMAPLEFFERVWQARGHRLLSENLSYKSDYAHTLAKRVRDVIEPDPKNPIYLLNQKGEGYWLENCRFS